MKKLVRQSTNIIAPIIAAGAFIAMIVDIGSQIISGSTNNLLMNIAGWLIFIAFMVFVWHATILHIESSD
ncbi:hypothetical protein [Sphingopyxis sp.]|uniref:hypothetical protein n=1 Tax=Sphingopyxis sp. TaxID=1908224 RepID=UPI003F71D20A